MQKITRLILFICLIPLLSIGQGTQIVHYTIEVPDKVHAGDSIAVAVTVHIEPDWYLYAPVNINRSQNMHITQVQLFPPASVLVPAGSLHIPAPTQKGPFQVYKGADNRFVQYFRTDAKSKTQSLIFKGRFTYQACNNSLCYPPVTEKFEKQILIIGADDKQQTGSGDKQILNNSHVENVPSTDW